MKESLADEAAAAGCRRERNIFIESIRQEANKRLYGHVGIIDGLSLEDLLALSKMGDDPPVLVGRISGDR